MAIILNANKVNLFVSSVLFVFWYHSPNFLDTPRTSAARDRLDTHLSNVPPWEQMTTFGRLGEMRTYIQIYWTILNNVLDICWKIYRQKSEKNTVQ
jgi:hypothetical protein